MSINRQNDGILLNPEFIVCRSGNEIAFASTQKILVLHNKDSCQLFRRIAPYLDGRLVDEIAEKTNIPKGELRSFLEKLEREKLILWRKTYDPLIFFPNFFELSSDTNIFDNEVVIPHLTPTTRKLLISLILLGFKKCRIVKESIPANVKKALWELAQGMGSHIEFRAFSDVSQGDNEVIFVSLSDVYNLEEAIDVFKTATKFGKPFIIGIIIDGQIWVLKASDSGNSPCPFCLILRRDSDSRHPGIYSRLVKDAFSDLTVPDSVYSLMIRCILNELLYSSWKKESNGNRSICLDLRFGTFTYHNLQRVPNCSFHNGRLEKARSVLPKNLRSSQAENPSLDDLMSSFVDPYCGIIRKLVKRPLPEGEPGIFEYAAETCTPTSFTDAASPHVVAGVASFNVNWAKIRAIMEALERYCAITFKLSRLKKTSYRSVKHMAVNPSDFVLFSKDQYTRHFPFSPPSDEKKMFWVQGISLTSNSRIFIPASLAYLHFPGLRAKELFMPPTSIGFAAGLHFAQTIFRCVAEIIERDSAILVWLRKIRVPKIDLVSIKSPLLRHILSDITQCCVEPTVLLTTLDQPIHSVMAILKDDRDSFPAATFGLAAGYDLKHIIIKSIEEALMVRHTVQFMKSYPEIEYPRSIMEHVLYYARHDNCSKLDFLFEGDTIGISKINRMGPSPSSLSGVLRHMKEKGFNPYAVDVTTPDVSVNGVQVWKVLVPGLTFPEENHAWRFLGAERLYTVHEKINYKYDTVINPDPHPFG